jgi:hypothetical protein
MKDTFRSQREMPNFYFPNFVEDNCELNALVASLSTAAVTIGDKIGHTNATLIMMTCNLFNNVGMADGTLLKTSKPATAIDRTFTKNPGFTGDLWSTYSTINEYKFYYIFATNISNAFRLYPKDIDLFSEQTFYYYELYDRNNLKEFNENDYILVPELKAVIIIR